jgi:hypothetical protein
MYNNALILATALVASTVSAVSATSARAADPEINRWLNGADRAVHASLEKAHVPTGAQSVDVRFDIDGDYLRSPQVVKSSGSRDLDASVAGALRWVAVQTPPSALYGHAVVMHIAVGGSESASAIDSLLAAPRPTIGGQR